jgi:hypothetical protein
MEGHLAAGNKQVTAAKACEPLGDGRRLKDGISWFAQRIWVLCPHIYSMDLIKLICKIESVVRSSPMDSDAVALMWHDGTSISAGCETKPRTAYARWYPALSKCCRSATLQLPTDVAISAVSVVFLATDFDVCSIRE